MLAARGDEGAMSDGRGGRIVCTEVLAGGKLGKLGHFGSVDEHGGACLLQYREAVLNHSAFWSE